VALVVLRVFFFRPFDAPSVSMAPSVNQGDYFLVAQRAYAAHDPQRGDVIVFNWTDGSYVKRIIGIPGDRVQMRGGMLFLNGKVVPRRRVDNPDADVMSLTPGVQYRETLPGGRTYRTIDTGITPQDDTAEFHVPQGRYFVLGDNRDNSSDSRLDMGFVAREDIVGRVTVKYFDGLRGAPVWSAVD